MNPYNELGVRRNASPRTIKAAYRRLAKTAHPDVGGDRAVFERIQTAYSVLMDPERRAHFDRTGEIPEDRPENENAEALSCLAQTFDAVVNNLLQAGREPHKVDIVSMMRRKLVDITHQRGKERAAARAALPKWRAMRERFTVKDGKPNVMASIVAARIANIEQMLARSEEADAIAARAIEILDDHEFRFEQERPAASPFGLFSRIGSGTATTATMP